MARFVTIPIDLPPVFAGLAAETFRSNADQCACRNAWIGDWPDEGREPGGRLAQYHEIVAVQDRKADHHPVVVQHGGRENTGERH